MIESAISRGVSIGILLVLHKITTFFMDDGKGKLMARHRTFLKWSLPLPKFSAFIGAKYSFHALGYLLSPATTESLNIRVLVFESLMKGQWLRWYLTQLDL